MTFRRDEGLALAIVRQMGEIPSSFREIVGQGDVNHVFVVATAKDGWVVRFHRDPLDTDDYTKEAWCLRTMAASGVPVPEFVATGFCEGVAFIVQTFVPGESGDSRRSSELWRTLGRYARVINETPLDDSAPDSLLSRFGRDPIANWQQHLAYNINQLTSADRLLALGAYRPEDQARLRAVFEGLHGRVNRFGLTHGDLVPSNVLLPENSPPVVIDWGCAGTGPAPYHDYSRIWFNAAYEGFTAGDLDAFAEGYGVPVAGLIGTMRDIHLLHSIDVVRWALDRRPDRTDAYVANARNVVIRRFSP